MSGSINEEVQAPTADYEPFILWYKAFYKQQVEYCLNPSFQRWFIGGNGTGKTLVDHWNPLAYGLGLHPHQDPNRYDKPFPGPPLKIRILVPDFEKVEEVSLDKLFNPQVIIWPNGKRTEVGPLMPESAIKPKSKFTKDSKRIKLKNGTVFQWVTNEQGWKAMRGPEFDILVVDEECDERVFQENVRGLRNAKGGGKIIAGLTPPFEEGKGPTWTKDKVVDAFFNQDLEGRDLFVINACMRDNPAITEKFIKEFTQGMTKEQVSVVVDGQYPAWGDLVHPYFQDHVWNPQRCEGHLLMDNTPLPGNDEADWLMAFDWHPSKPCAAIWGFVDSDKNLVIYDELDPRVADRCGDDIDSLADVMRSIEGFPHEDRRFRRWQDPSASTEYSKVRRGFSAWDAFRLAGIVTSVGRNRDPHLGISWVNEFFRGNSKDMPRVYIYERCKNLRRALNNHYWVRGQDGVGKPDPKWSDFPVTLKYIVQGIHGKTGRRKKINKWPIQSFLSNKSQRQVRDISKWF